MTAGAWRTGRLPTSAELVASADREVPVSGELFDVVHDRDGVTIEHIVSGAGVEPVEYEQDHDEWVLVLEGSATLDVAGSVVHVRTGDWLFLPAHVTHTVASAEPGTRWLGVHVRGRPRP